jgi:hypothetical protein
MPALSLMPGIACHGHNIGAHAKRSLRHGCGRFRAEPKTTVITNSTVVTVVCVIY